MKSLAATCILALLCALPGCSNMSRTQQTTLSGSAMGAAGGAVIGAMAGNAGMGAAIGAAAGAGGGYLYGKHKDAEDRAYQEGRAAGRAESEAR